LKTTTIADTIKVSFAASETESRSGQKWWHSELRTEITLLRKSLLVSQL